MPIFTRSWNTAASSNGPHSLYAVITDFSGNTFQTSTVNVTVDNVPPDPGDPPPVITPPDPPIVVPPTIIVEEPLSLGALFYNTLGEFSTFIAQAVFPSATDTDVATVARPPVPVIDSTIGFSEFIQINIANSGNGTEGVHVYFHSNPVETGAVGSLFVKNKSSDPNVRITRVDYNAAATGAGGFAPQGSLDGSGWEDVTPVLPTANFTIGAPFSYNVQYLNAVADQLLYTTPGTAADYYDVPLDIYTTARLNLTGFSATELSVDEPEVAVPVIARGFVVYVGALGRTVFAPLLPAFAHAGYFASFGQANGAGPIVGTVDVYFSTGARLTQTVYDVGPFKAGFIQEASTVGTAETHWELEDYFLFISESTFSNDLDAPSGRWEDMLSTPPEGVYVTTLARFHEILSTTINGVKLDPDTVYYFRVGARRSVSLATETGTYIYSQTLSNEETGQLSVAFALDEGTPAPDPVVTNTIKQAFVWGQAGTNRIEQDASFPLEVPADCTLERWYMDVRTAGSGMGNLTVNVRRNGTDLFSGASIPSLAVGAFSATGTAFSTTALVAGDQLRFDVRTVHSGPGSRVKLELIVRQTTVES